MPRARLITAFLLSAAALPFAASSPASAQVEGKTNQQWFPDLLDLSPLRQESPKSNPMGSDYDYRRQVERWWTETFPTAGGNDVDHGRVTAA